MKKTLAAALCACLVLGALPGQAVAAGLKGIRAAPRAGLPTLMAPIGIPQATTALPTASAFAPLPLIAPAIAPAALPAAAPSSGQVSLHEGLAAVAATLGETAARAPERQVATLETLYTGRAAASPHAASVSRAGAGKVKTGLSARAKTALSLTVAAGAAAVVAAPLAAGVSDSRTALSALAFSGGAWAGATLLRPLLRAFKFDPAASAAGMVLGILTAGVIAGAAAAWLTALSPLAAGAVVSAALAAMSLRSGLFRGAADAWPQRTSPPFFRTISRGGRAFIEIDDSRLDKPFLFSATLDRGLGENDFYAGRSENMEFLGTFRRAGNSIELVMKNTRYRAPPGTPLAKALERSVPDSTAVKARIVEREPIVGRSLIALDDLFLQDLYEFAPSLGVHYGGRYELDRDSSRLEDSRSYPRNTEIKARLGFKRVEAAGLDADPAATHLTDTRSPAMTMRYSLSALPEAGYRPRQADDRVGHFTATYHDWSDDQAADLNVNLIQRWRLEKQDPAAALSPVKNPIVYWIDATVPVQYREAIARGVLAWNKAFERIGFKDAITVRQAPEDGSFDASDARHNVITYHMERGTGYAIGPSRANPLTGEIYNAGVALSAFHARQSLNLDFKGVDELDDVDLALRGKRAHAHHQGCRHGERKAHEAAMTAAVLESRGGLTEEERRRFIEDYMTDLMLHEIGHTLGLRHNFVAKSWRDADEIAREPQFVASVMDYTPGNIAAPGEPQGRYWTTDIGPYDFWAIEYAYRPFDGLTPEQERQELAKVAGRSGEPGLAYATDEDSGVDVDPSAQPMILGRDGLGFIRGRMAIVRELWDSLEKTQPAAGEGYQRHHKAFLQGWLAYFRVAQAAARFVGGLTFRRHHAGTSGAGFDPVPAARQREALALLDKAVFNDSPFTLSPRLLRHLVPGRLNEVMRQYPDLKPLAHHDLILWLRDGALSRLLAPDVLRRVVENAKLVENKKDVFTVRELVERLSRSIWAEAYAPSRAPQVRSKRAISVMRRELQERYLLRLIDIGYGEGDADIPEVSTIVRAHLDALQARLGSASRITGWERESRDHLEHAVYKIESAELKYAPR